MSPCSSFRDKFIEQVHANIAACTPTIRTAETILADWNAATPDAETRKLHMDDLKEMKDAQDR